MTAKDYIIKTLKDKIHQLEVELKINQAHEQRQIWETTAGGTSGYPTIDFNKLKAIKQWLDESLAIDEDVYTKLKGSKASYDMKNKFMMNARGMR